MKWLVVTQLSNYNREGKFDLACDSGWQMCINRCREMLKLDPTLRIDIVGALAATDDVDGQTQLVAQPEAVNPDLWKAEAARLQYVSTWVVPNALLTRYTFDPERHAFELGLQQHKSGNVKPYDVVYLNDPMLLRHYKAMFQVYAGYQPAFVVHNHFVDSPACPKFPTEASLWFGQLEASARADFNFWQCGSALNEFTHEAKKTLASDLVTSILGKSMPWDDGYSVEEITSKPDMDRVRFDPAVFQKWKDEGKVVVFVPNRVGGRGRSSDYTNCGKFLFETLPELRKRRQDFVVLAGNPNQKFSNKELEQECGENGYVSLVEDSFNRDEFKLVAKNSDIAVGLYDQDTYGGTVARECIELGCLPLWLDNYEYADIAKACGYPHLVKRDMSDLATKTSVLIEHVKTYGKEKSWSVALKDHVRKRCSYEATTPVAMAQIAAVLAKKQG